MAISTWADEEYYVDSNGIMVANQWVKTNPKWDRTEEQVWYYFGSSGKMVEDGWKKIDGKVIKNRSVDDNDHTEYTLNKSGLLTHVDDEPVGNESFNDPIEPEFTEWDW